jgi:hypothetical protein
MKFICDAPYDILCPCSCFLFPTCPNFILKH